MEIKNWVGRRISFYLWIGVAALSLFLAIYGTVYAIYFELNYDRMNPVIAVISPFMNFLVFVIISDFFVFGMVILFLLRVRIGLWSLLFTIFPACYLFSSFLQEIGILLLASVVNFLLLIPMFRNIMKSRDGALGQN